MKIKFLGISSSSGSRRNTIRLVQGNPCPNWLGESRESIREIGVEFGVSYHNEKKDNFRSNYFFSVLSYGVGGGSCICRLCARDRL